MSHDTPIVFVVDDDVSVRESLESLIRCAGWQPETFASAQEFLTRPRVLVPSCLVLDVSLPGLNGLDLQKRVAAERTDMPIIFITGHGDVPMTVQAMKAGAVEFLTKPFGDDVLLSAIRQAIERSRVALDQEAEMRALRGPLRVAQPLANGEVMALVVSGLLNKQVGGELGISEITVKAHRGRVMRKMEARISRRPGENGREAPAGGRSDYGGVTSRYRYRIIRQSSIIESQKGRLRARLNLAQELCFTFFIPRGPFLASDR